MKNWILMASLILSISGSASAQIDLDKILDLGNLLGKTMQVQKGYVPKFSIGNVAIPNINKLGEIFGLKRNQEITKLYKTFKTGRAIYKVAAYAGSAIALYGTIRSLDKSALKQDYQGAIISGLSSIGTGLISKFLTKGASYKAVDIFNGIARKKIKDIFSIQPASSTIGMGIYVKL